MKEVSVFLKIYPFSILFSIFNQSFVKYFHISYDIHDLCFTNTKLVCERTNRYLYYTTLKIQESQLYLRLNLFRLLAIAYYYTFVCIGITNTTKQTLKMYEWDNITEHKLEKCFHRRDNGWIR